MIQVQEATADNAAWIHGKIVEADLLGLPQGWRREHTGLRVGAEFQHRNHARLAGQQCCKPLMTGWYWHIAVNIKTNNTRAIPQEACQDIRQRGVRQWPGALLLNIALSDSNERHSRVRRG